MGAACHRWRSALSGNVWNLPRPYHSGCLRKESPRDFPGWTSRRLHLVWELEILGLDDLSLLSVGLGLRQPGCLQPHGWGIVLPSESRRGNLSARCCGIYLERARYELRKLTWSPHDFAGFQRPHPHCSTFYVVQIRSHRSSRWSGQVHLSWRMSTFL